MECMNYKKTTNDGKKFPYDFENEFQDNDLRKY